VPNLAAQPQPGSEVGLLLVDPAGQRAEAPLLETDVCIWVTGVIARARVTQRFRNPSPEWVEGVYLFPLPETASVDTLRMLIGSRVVEGEIHERGQARRVYDTAKRSGRKASLVEQQRPNVFQTSVANIGPDETVEITIEYQDTVHYDSGELRLRFPLVVAARYMPPVEAGDPSQPWTGGEPDEPFCVVTSAGSEPINPVTLAVELEAGLPLRTLYSPSHRIETVEVDDATIVTLDEGTTPADRDFVLAWAPDVGSRPKAAVFAEDVGDQTFVLLMVLPPDQPPARGDRLPREVVFVIDTSGSMAGASIEQAKLALLMALDRLQDGDRFNVVEFNTTAIRLFPGSVPASVETIDQARSFVDSMQADGGTNIWDALVQAFDGVAAPGAIRQVIFVTDGAVGNETELFGYIESHLGASRLFTVGIGSAPNTHFMRKAAQFGRGTFTYVGSTLEVSEQMENLFRKLETPALAEIDVRWDDEAAEFYPQRVPDLYSGEPLVVTALLPNGRGGIELTGFRGGFSWETSVDVCGGKRGAVAPGRSPGNEFPGSVNQSRLEPTEIGELESPSGDFPTTQPGNEFPGGATCLGLDQTTDFVGDSNIPAPDTLGIAKLWARRKIESITDSMIEGVDAQSMRNAVVALGLEHHLVTQYTSLVAVDVTPTSPAAGGESRNVPVNRPHGSTATLPRTATPATLYALIALVLLAAALMLRPGSDG
jgi:Ca-activated chloride channel family protein